MLNLIGLGFVLVISNLLTMVASLYLTCKLMSSGWFIKKYLEWFKATMKTIENAMEDFEDDEL